MLAKRRRRDQIRQSSIHRHIGIVKSVTIPVEQLEDTLENGKWFDGSSIEGFARIAESDMYLMPDPDTFAVIPWERGDNTTARMICWVHMPDGQLFDGDPRAVLLRATREVEELGYEYLVGPELEFLLIRPDENGQVRTLPQIGGYFDLSPTKRDVRKEMRSPARPRYELSVATAKAPWPARN